MKNAATHEPDPKPGKQKVLDLVLADLQARAEAGHERYGMYLQTHNGRDALIDAYQEALDLCMYLRQAIAERDDPDAWGFTAQELASGRIAETDT